MATKTVKKCVIHGCHKKTEVTEGNPATKLCLDCFIERFEPR